MLYSFLYVILTAIGTTLVQKLDSTISPLLTLLIASFITLIYFNVINLHKLKFMYQTCWQNKRIWISMMITVLIMWGCAITTPGLIGASMYAFLYFSWRGALGFFSLSIHSKFKTRNELFCVSLVLILILINVILQMKLSSSKETIIGIILALIGGSSAFVYFKQSQTVVKTMHLTATQVLAVRFHMTVLVLLPLLAKSTISHQLTPVNVMCVTFLAFITMIIPLYFGQKALEKISSEHHAIISSLCPVATGIIQEIIFRDVQLSQGITYILYSTIIAGFYYSKRSMRKTGAIA